MLAADGDSGHEEWDTETHLYGSGNDYVIRTYFNDVSYPASLVDVPLGSSSYFTLRVCEQEFHYNNHMSNQTSFPPMDTRFYRFDTMYLGLNRVIWSTHGRTGEGLCHVNIRWIY